MIHASKLGLGLATVIMGGALLTSCHDANDPGTEYAPQMYDSVPLEPLKQVVGEKGPLNPYNPQGIHERVPPQGAIPRGKLAFFTHISPDDLVRAETQLVNPLRPTPANLADGKVLYERYCQHCHGEAGDGQGLVGVKFKGVPNYQTGAYKTMNDGHIFHVIQYGKGRMMPHGSQVNPEERWKIALYVKVLQNGGQAPTEAAPADGAATAAATPTAEAKPAETAATPAVTAGTDTKPAAAPAVAPAAPAAAPANEPDTRTPVQRATDKIRQTHVF